MARELFDWANGGGMRRQLSDTAAIALSSMSFKSKRDKKGRLSPSLRVSVSILLAACCLLPFSFPPASAQSGRQNPSKPASQDQPKKPSAPPAAETRPRRATEQPPDASQDDKPIRLSADLVTVIASVTDATGNHVSGLSQNDFTLYEDNTEQDIAGFYPQGEMPLRLVFLFDTSSSIRHRFDFEQRAAAQFFRRLMRPGDQGAIMSVSTDPRLELQFTPNVERLVGTLAALKPEGATALYNAMIEAARYIRPSEGRHVMVVLSDGTDTASASNLAQALTEVQKSDTVIYAVHSTGVAPSANVQDLAGEFVLKAMAEDTGGRAFFPPIYDDQRKEARDLEEIYRRIAAEIRAQYVLTYYSKADARASFKKIRLEAKRPGLQVRTRSGYYTSK